MELNDENNKDDEQFALPPPDGTDDGALDNQENTSDISKLGRSTTTSVSESIERLRSQISSQHQTMAPSITLKILGVDTPITFQDRYEIILGRVNPSTNERPDVDLSGLPVNVVGISRKHLKLIHTKGKWYVEDLGSRNGSWINGKLMTAFQRYSLTDGDQLRAGNVIFIVMMNAIIQPPAQPQPMAESSNRSFRLTSTSKNNNQGGLSPTYITESLMPYIQALIDMMQYVDRAKNRSYHEISMVSFTFQRGVIVVQLSYVNEILDFLRNEKALEFNKVTQDRQSSRTSDVSISEIINDLLNRFAEQQFVTLPPDQSKNYQWSMAKPLRLCIESDLWLTV